MREQEYAKTIKYVNKVNNTNKKNDIPWFNLFCAAQSTKIFYKILHAHQNLPLSVFCKDDTTFFNAFNSLLLLSVLDFSLSIKSSRSLNTTEKLFLI